MNVISKLLGFVRGKPLLFIGYMLLGTVLSVSGLAVALYYSRESTRDDLESARLERNLISARLITAEENNAAQQDKITELQAIIEKQDALARSLLNRYKGLVIRDEEVRNKLRQLESNDAEVSRFLDQRIPTELRSLLNATTRRKGATGSVEAAHSPDATVHGARAPGYNPNN